MAPPLPMRAELEASLKLSSPSIGAVGSVVLMVLMILLLLLCFRLKRNRRQLSTRSFKMDSNTSELIRMTKLEAELSPEEKPVEGRKMHKGSSLPNHQAEKQTNGFAADLQPENSNFPRDTNAASPGHRRTEKSRMSDLDPLGSLAPHMACPNPTTPGSLQSRKLPMTPKEAHISIMEPLIQSMDSQVYESIQVEEGVICTSGCSEPKEAPRLPARARNPFAESAESGGKEIRTPEWSSGMPTQLVAALQCNESHQQLQEMTLEEEASVQPGSAMEKRLSEMYARVCKKPKAAQPLQSANHDRPTEEEEEEPPPIPEKRFEDLYESLSIGTEMQGDETS
ncbi:uncharacterized protein LOC128324584 isoform X2 [Hemicordylus capensis]|uniref:uncharacterized protein LOC128324584 isoform X2 n=1 Tax=Hemicordylus capensis TaxID=884348 RepID=UPI00230321ED|nr:uncharacterized protein LOC128324584 isoform X2 [Hemicordylus capensis]